MAEEKKESFYIKKDERVTKKVLFFRYNQSGSTVFVVEGDDKPEDATLLGEVVYTLLKPNWALKNLIRSRSSSTNLLGTVGLDPYIMNELVVQYLLKDWSIELKLEFEDDGNGYEQIKDIKTLTSSSLEVYVFEAIIMLYNRFLD